MKPLSAFQLLSISAFQLFLLLPLPAGGLNGAKLEPAGAARKKSKIVRSTSTSRLGAGRRLVRRRGVITRTFTPAQVRSQRTPPYASRNIVIPATLKWERRLTGRQAQPKNSRILYRMDARTWSSYRLALENGEKNPRFRMLTTIDQQKRTVHTLTRH